MTSSIDVVVVGGGYFARFHINAWLRLPGVVLRAIVEPDATKHNELKNITTAAGSPDILLEESLSAVYEHCSAEVIDIATPPQTHAEIISQALALNCPVVVCQKPFCGSYNTAKETNKSISNSQSTVVVHENFRFQPWFREIKNLLNQNLVGTVLQATFRLRPGDGQGPNAYLERQPYFRDMQNFLIHETGVHYIDVFRYLFGEPDALSADLHRLNPAIKGEDAGHFIFYYNNGLRAHFDGNRLLDHSAENTRLTMGEMLIEGTHGSLALYGNGDLQHRKHGTTEWQAVKYAFNDNDFGGDCVYLTQEHIVDHLQKKNTTGKQRRRIPEKSAARRAGVSGRKKPNQSEMSL